MNKIIISAPFGNYLKFPGTTGTLGTFTLNPRSGRLWRFLKTVRYNRRQQSWINKLRLPNPGIASVHWQEACASIVSIHGFNKHEWHELIQIAQTKTDWIELNLSCPNVQDQYSTADLEMPIRYALQLEHPVIAKLPPIKWLERGRMLFNFGIRWFHLCNTIPSPGGGISGKPLKQYSLWAIEEFRKEWGNEVKIIGGGGITNTTDVEDYRSAGADHFSIGSVLLNPWNWHKIKTWVKLVNNKE